MTHVDFTVKTALRRPTPLNARRMLRFRGQGTAECPPLRPRELVPPRTGASLPARRRPPRSTGRVVWGTDIIGGGMCGAAAESWRRSASYPGSPVVVFDVSLAKISTKRESWVFFASLEQPPHNPTTHPGRSERDRPTATQTDRPSSRERARPYRTGFAKVFQPRSSPNNPPISRSPPRRAMANHVMFSLLALLTCCMLRSTVGVQTDAQAMVSIKGSLSTPW